jgi:hypothetical protein
MSSEKFSAQNAAFGMGAVSEMTGLPLSIPKFFSLGSFAKS